MKKLIKLAVANSFSKIFLILIFLALISAGVFGAYTRTFQPSVYANDNNLLVTIRTSNETGTTTYLVTDVFPTGWIPSDINCRVISTGAYCGSGDWITFGNSTAEWVFYDGEDRNLTYKIKPASGSTGPKTFTVSGSAYKGNVFTTYDAQSQTINPNNPPTISITSPSNGATLNADFDITATATDTDNGDGISKVVFYRNGAEVSTDSDGPPYTAKVLIAGLTDGQQYKLKAKAYDFFGATGESAEVIVTISKGSFVVSTGSYGQLTLPVSGNGQVSLSQASVNPVSDSYTYAWSVTNSPTGSTTSFSNTKILQPTFYFNKPGDYNIKLTVTSGGITKWVQTKITVVKQNAPPVASNRNYSVAEDGYVSVTLSASDPEGLPLCEYIIHELPQNGDMINFTSTSPTFTYKPNNNYFGPDRLVFVVSDCVSESNEAIVNFDVIPVNDPPTMDAISDLTRPASTSAVDFVVKLTGISSGPNEYQDQMELTADSNDPLLVYVSNNSYIYDDREVDLFLNLRPNKWGTAKITVTVDDKNGALNSVIKRVFLVNVTHTNSPPIITFFTEPKSNPAVYGSPARILFSANATDSDGTITKVEFFRVGNPDSIITTVTNPVNPPAYAFTWDKVLEGTYYIYAKATDNSGAVTQTNSITVIVNPPPQFSLTVNKYGSGGGSFTFSPAGTPCGGAVANCKTYPQGTIVTITGQADQNSTLTNWVGCSSNPTPNDCNVTIDKAKAVNIWFKDTKPPVILSTAVVPQDTNAKITWTTDELASYILDYGTSTNYGTGLNDSVLRPAHTREITSLIPSTKYYYRITAKDANQNQGTRLGEFTTNQAPNRPPSGEAKIWAVYEDSKNKMRIIGTDPDGDTITYQITQQPEHGTILNFNPSTGDLNYNPAPNYFGADYFYFKVTDSHGLQSVLSATVSVDVMSVNDPPTLNPIGDVPILENSGEKVVSLSGIGAGPNESQNLTITATSNNTAIIPNLISNLSVSYTSPQTNGSIKFTPVLNTYGVVTITVSVKDSDNSVTSKTFKVTVNHVNKPPTVSLTATSPTFTAPATITLTAVPTDSDGQIQKVEFYGDGTWLGEKTAVPWTFVWSNVGAGSHTLKAVATDNNGATAEDTKSVNVSQGTTPGPEITIGLPTGKLSSDTTQTVIRVLTKTDANCKYEGQSGMPYDSMRFTFKNMDTMFAGIDHQATITISDTSKTIYVRCVDNITKIKNTSDYQLNLYKDEKPQITISKIQDGAEPDTNGIFRVQRTGSTANPLIVKYTLGGNATNGTDYMNTVSTITIPTGKTTAYINITPRDDTIAEGNETVSVTIESPNNLPNCIAPTTGNVTYSPPLICNIAGSLGSSSTQMVKVDRNSKIIIQNPEPGMTLLFWNGGWATHMFDDLDMTWAPALPQKITLTQGFIINYAGSTPVNKARLVLLDEKDDNFGSSPCIKPTASNVTYSPTTTCKFKGNLGIDGSTMVVVDRKAKSYIDNPEPGMTLQFWNGGWHTYSYDDLDLVWSEPLPQITPIQGFIIAAPGSQEMTLTLLDEEYKNITNYAPGTPNSVSIQITDNEKLDNNAPKIFGQDAALPLGSVRHNLHITTDENANCKYSYDPGVAFTPMLWNFSNYINGVSGDYGLDHNAIIDIKDINQGGNKTVHIKCKDELENANQEDYNVKIKVLVETCTDGVRNNGETGVDCGGPCGACSAPPGPSPGPSPGGPSGPSGPSGPGPSPGPSPRKLAANILNIYVSALQEGTPATIHIDTNGNYKKDDEIQVKANILSGRKNVYQDTKTAKVSADANVLTIYLTNKWTPATAGDYNVILTIQNKDGNQTYSEKSMMVNVKGKPIGQQIFPQLGGQTGGVIIDNLQLQYKTYSAPILVVTLVILMVLLAVAVIRIRKKKQNGNTN